MTLGKPQKSSFFSGQSFQRGGGVRGCPISKKVFFFFNLSPLSREAGGLKALVDCPRKKLRSFCGFPQLSSTFIYEAGGYCAHNRPLQPTKIFTRNSTKIFYCNFFPVKQQLIVISLPVLMVLLRTVYLTFMYFLPKRSKLKHRVQQ